MQGQKSPFYAVFFSVVAITILAGVALIVMAELWIEPTETQHSVFQAMDFTWKAGVGAILALISGKIS